MKSQAELIAERFEVGTSWVSDTNEQLIDTLEAESTDKDQDWERELTKYQFEDGSSVVLSVGAWDIGPTNVDGCFCWPAANETCRCFEDSK